MSDSIEADDASSRPSRIVDRPSWKPRSIRPLSAAAAAPTAVPEIPRTSLTGLSQRRDASLAASSESSRRGEAVRVTPKPPDVRPATVIPPEEPRHLTRPSQSQPPSSSADKNENTISKMEKLAQAAIRAQYHDDVSKLIRPTASSSEYNKTESRASSSEYNMTERRSQGVTAESYAGRSVSASSGAFEPRALHTVPELWYEAERRGRTRCRQYSVDGTMTGDGDSRRDRRRDGRSHHRHHETHADSLHLIIAKSMIALVAVWAVKLHALAYYVAATFLSLNWRFLLPQGKILPVYMAVLVGLVKICEILWSPSFKALAQIAISSFTTILTLLGGHSTHGGSGAPPFVLEKPVHGSILEQMWVQGHVLRECRGLLDALEGAAIASSMPNSFTEAKKIMAGGSEEYTDLLREYRDHHRDWGNYAELFHIQLSSHNMTLQHYTQQRQSRWDPSHWAMSLLGRSHEVDVLAHFSIQLGGWYVEQEDNLNDIISSFNKDMDGLRSVRTAIDATINAISWKGPLSERDMKRWRALSSNLRVSSRTMVVAVRRLKTEVAVIEGKVKKVKERQTQLVDKRGGMLGGVNRKMRRDMTEQLRDNMVKGMVELLQV